MQRGSLSLGQQIRKADRKRNPRTETREISFLS